MAEAQTELDAENAIFAAVMSEAPVSRPDAQDLDEIEKRDEEVLAPDEADRREEVAAKGEPEEPGDDYIEVPIEDGKEPLKISLKDAIEAVQAREKFEAEKPRLVEEITGRAQEQAVAMVSQARHYAQGVGHQLQAVLQLIAPPQPPDPEMANPRSEKYNPDAYMYQDAQYRQVMMRYQQVQQTAAGLQEMVQQQQAYEDVQRREREDHILVRLWPETKDDAYNEQVWADLRQHYGYTDDEIGNALSTHKNALVARDALAYRKMMAKSPEVREKVTKAGPKIVRSNQEARGTAAAQRDAKGQFTGSSLARLQKTQSDDDAAAHFAALARAGRI